jgi:uncharacterized membrane protein
LANWETIVRLSLHVLAATIWVGGQFTLAGLVPTLRSGAPNVTQAVAKQFARLAWPAFVILVGTGVWNINAESGRHHASAWQAVLGAKMAVVLVSGVATFLHQRAETRSAIALTGAISSLSAATALVLGVALAG